MVNDSADVMSTGRSFHICAPATGKAWLPTHLHTETCIQRETDLCSWSCKDVVSRRRYRQQVGGNGRLASEMTTTTTTDCVDTRYCCEQTSRRCQRRCLAASSSTRSCRTVRSQRRNYEIPMSDQSLPTPDKHSGTY